MKRLYLDIETLPAAEGSYENLKKIFQKKEAKGKNIDFEQFLLGTGFDGSFGRILCIGYAIDDAPADVLCADDNSEKSMLEKFWDIAAEADLFIGHNIMDFDLRFIYQRSVINDVAPDMDLKYFFVRYKSEPVYDTMKEWTKWSMGPSIGLEHLALALGIPSPKDGIDGSQVWEFYQKGRVNEILEYCKKDVETTRLVYKKMNFLS